MQFSLQTSRRLISPTTISARSVSFRKNLLPCPANTSAFGLIIFVTRQKKTGRSVYSCPSRRGFCSRMQVSNVPHAYLTLTSCEVDAGCVVACQLEAESVVAAGRYTASQLLAVCATSQSQGAISNRIASLKSAGIAGFVCGRPAERSIGLQYKSYVCSIAECCRPVANVSRRLNLCCLWWSVAAKRLQC